MSDNPLALIDTTGNGLARMDAEQVFKLGQVLYESKYFKDVGSASQAIVKILRGQELGIGPIAAMENVYVIEGKTALSYSLIGAQIKRSGRYDYRVIESNDDRCEIAFFEQGKAMGRASFSMDDAKAAGLANKNIWKQYPSTMLFARAMSQGARRFTPDVFGGSIYTPEELQGIKEPETAIDTVAKPVERQSEPAEAKDSKAKRSRSRQELEDRYTVLCGEAREWNNSDRLPTIEFLTYKPEWSDDELTVAGRALAQALDQVAPKEEVPA